MTQLRFPVLLTIFLAMTARAEAAGRGQALDDLCQWFFGKLGFSATATEYLSGAMAAVFLAAVCYVIYRQNRPAPPDE